VETVVSVRVARCGRSRACHFAASARAWCARATPSRKGQGFDKRARARARAVLSSRQIAAGHHRWTTKRLAKWRRRWKEGRIERHRRLCRQMIARVTNCQLVRTFS
jgi:hypothetical protein